MPAAHIQEEIQNLELPNRVQLFQLTLNGVNTYFTNSAKIVNEVVQDIWWNNNKYRSVPVSITGLGYTEDALIENPKLTLTNINETLTILLSSIPRLEGGKLTFVETFDTYIKFNATANSNVFIQRHYFKISRLVQRNRQQLVYELSTFMELENLKFPRRLILREGAPNLRFEGAGLNKQG